jgi:hypothetical protein
MENNIRIIAQEIGETVKMAAMQLSQLNAEEVSFKESPHEWSKKEILGHLIDSAANNHQRFVRASYHVASEFPPYSQNEWVNFQHYQEADWKNLIELWTAYNLHLCHVIEHIPLYALAAPCNLGKSEPVALEFVIQDYLRHLRHHLSKLLSEPRFG